MSSKREISEHFKHSDKDTRHSYLEVYAELTDGKDIRSILEIGVDKGGSLWLWRSWFPEAKITGVDITLSNVCVPIPDNTILLERDVKTLDTDECWDLIVDDGSHELDDQLWVLDNLIENLRPGGIVVIEDVQSMGAADTLQERLPGAKIMDRRHVKNQRDDILLVYRRSDDAG